MIPPREARLLLVAVFVCLCFYTSGVVFADKTHHRSLTISVTFPVRKVCTW